MSSSEDVLKKFGRYFLLDRVAQGGMAEIYRARVADTDGAGRIIVIKRIQSNYRNNAEFLQMFKAEIKLTMGFSHPNIVQLYDYGDGDGTPYIAMEYVDGKTVRQFAARYFKKEKLLPIDLVLYIVEEAARGLSYAHTFKDKMSGDELKIVHRDISPQNIIISYDGQIKVIDFGIAKAKTSADLTRTGIIKGKPSYMAPEQVAGQNLDARSDVFALGIVFWELLTGKKLFSTTGRNEYSILKMIEKCDRTIKPPSVLNPNIPPELDAIVMKALKKKLSERYQSAAELQKALQRYLAVHFPDFNLSELPYWMDRLFSEDRRADQEKLRQLTLKSEEMLRLQPNEVSSDSQVSSAVYQGDTPSINGVIEKGIRAVGVDNPLNPDKKSSSKDRRNVAPQNEIQLEGMDQQIQLQNTTSARRSRGHTSYYAGAFRPQKLKKRAVMLGGAAALVALTLFPDMLLYIPGVAGFVRWTKVSLHEIRIGKTYVPVVSELLKPAPTSRPQTAQQQQPIRVVNPNSVFLTLRISPSGFGNQVWINGQRVPGAVPVIELPRESSVEVAVERPGFKPIKKMITAVPTKNTNELRESIILTPEVYGYLSVKGSLSADITVRELDPKTKAITRDSATWYFTSKFDQHPFPPGLYMVQLTNRVLEMEALELVRVEKNLITRVELELRNTPTTDLMQVAPDKVVGLLAWFRASSITGMRQGDTISQWNDSGRNLNQAGQTDPIRRPAFVGDTPSRVAAVRFNGNGQALDTETLASQIRNLKTFTLVYVARPSGVGAQTFFGCYKKDRSERVFDFGLASESRLMVRDSAQAHVYEGRSLAGGDGNPGSGSYAVFSTVITASSMLVYENGQRKIAAQTGGVDFTDASICSIGQGWARGRATEFLTGDVAEVLVYDHALSVWEQENIERYLSHIYGVALKR